MSSKIPTNTDGKGDAATRGTGPPPPSATTTITQQYRVIVTPSMKGGQLIRAGYNGHEWLVRVPAAAAPGDSVVFRMTPADMALAAAANPNSITNNNTGTGLPYINETAVLESTLPASLVAPATRSVRSIVQRLYSWGDEDLWVDPQRIVFLVSMFVLAFVFGLVHGTLYYTRFLEEEDYHNEPPPPSSIYDLYNSDSEVQAVTFFG